MHMLTLLLLAAGTLCIANERTAEKNFVEAWTNFFKKSERLFLGENDAEEKGTEAEIEEARIRSLRLQHVQNQILRKLRMRERPNVSATRGTLPLPVREGATMLPRHLTHDLDEKFTDDFYAKTEQKIVFPDDGENTDKCDGNPRNHPAACLTFTMPPDLQPQDVYSAELWIYKEKDPFDSHNQTMLVNEAVHWDIDKKFRKLRHIAIHSTDLTEGWIKIDVGSSAELWIEEGTANLEIICPTCGAPPGSSPLSLEMNNRPFLVLNTRYNSKKRRIRYLECSSGVSECCRERLYVSFADLGWDDWIVQPRGYHAHFCRGSCSSVAAVTLSGSHHQSVIKKLFHGNHPRRLEMKPCCTPTSFSSLQLFYMDSNNTITQKTLPNMIVESCGCM